MSANFISNIDGDWQFTYRTDFGGGDSPLPPKAAEFNGSMPVPGVWDDHLEPLKELDFWSTAKFNSDYRPVDLPLGTNPRDASLPFLLGVGWYRKEFSVPAPWASKTVTLRVGPAVMETWVWLNGKLIGHSGGHCAPFNVPLGDVLQPGKTNELVLAVSNLRKDRPGCDVRGYAGRSGGFRGPLSLHASSIGGEPEFHLYPTPDLGQIVWRLNFPSPENTSFNYAIVECGSGKTVLSGTAKGAGPSLEWKSGAENMCQWSDRSPELCRAEIRFGEGESISRIFGLRRLECRGTSLFLNGKPAYLRGLTDHAYFPLSCTPPRSLAYYRKCMKAYKNLGFNWIRLHTWVPPEEFMDAADQLGMMLQIEAAPGSGEGEWLDILRHCRRHPSVVIFCEGNEELLDEAKIARLRSLASLLKKEVPDALFNPQEALRGVDYGNIEDMGADVSTEPFPHSKRRLGELRDFSDVFAPYAWGMLSYGSSRGDSNVINERLKVYGRPCLAHEICIHGSYINLDLEHRYEGTRIGSGLFAAARRNLEKAGLLQNAPLYFRNSCAWMRELRKDAVEKTRRCGNFSGYDLLGATDQHWHRTGYDCGIMNEFFEMKPGEIADDVLKYNGERVLLLDLGKRRNYWEGSSFQATLLCSQFGSDDMRNCRLEWRLSGYDGRVLTSGNWNLNCVTAGGLHELGKIAFEIPALGKASKTKLHVSLRSADCLVENDWSLWIFPQPEPLNVEADEKILERFPSLMKSGSAKIRMLSKLDDISVSWIRDGGSAILLDGETLPSLQTSFQMNIAGRSIGNASTVVWEHPVMDDFPHEGFCDWQFHTMMEGGKAVLFEKHIHAFNPIIEIVSSYKTVRRQAALFEGSLGHGRLLVCSLNLSPNDPASIFLLERLIRHAQTPEFRPRTPFPEEFLNGKTSRQDGDDTVTDQALDPNITQKKGMEKHENK